MSTTEVRLRLRSTSGWKPKRDMGELDTAVMVPSVSTCSCRRCSSSAVSQLAGSTCSVGEGRLVWLE